MARQQPSWERVARVLGERMHHHAVCEEHPLETADEQCPFCADRAAYLMFRRKKDKATS